MRLSVLLSGIRPKNWNNLYESIGKSYTGGDWELIVISPYDLPYNLVNKDNIQWYRDFGSPSRCQQRALTYAKGDYINWASDDGIFVDKAMDIGFSLLDNDYKTIIVGKYLEGDQCSSNMMEDNYYILNNHLASTCKYIPNNTPLINVGLVSRKLLLELGGWDSVRFEVLPIAYNDFSVRCTNYGCKFIHQKEIMFTCGHMPGESGDHGPIHRAQVFKDEPIFKFIYNRPDSKDRIKIDINNWEKSPDRWIRRFGEGI